MNYANPSSAVRAQEHIEVTEFIDSDDAGSFSSAALDGEAIELAGGNQHISAEFYNPGFKGLRLYLQVLEAVGDTTLDVKVQAKGPDVHGLSGESTWYDLAGASFAQQDVTDEGTMVDLLIYPSATPVNNRVVSQVLPETWRIVATPAGTAPEVRFYLGAHLIP